MHSGCCEGNCSGQSHRVIPRTLQSGKGGGMSELCIGALVSCQRQGPKVLAAIASRTPIGQFFAIRSFIDLTRDFTAATLLSNAACSWGSSFSSTIRSTPPAPRTTGTPT